MALKRNLDWTEIDDKAVDTVRVLAMDAVQKVGNGHPGTAMSLAPAAYLLFQKVMRHDPADPDWISRDRFVLSCGHSSLTLYIQLFLGGWGLELEDLKSLRTWGSKTPGHPEYGHTAGVETTTGPLGQGIGNAVGMAMAARKERGLFDPDTPEGQSLFDHHIYALCSDGDIEEGVSAEASAIAGVQALGNLTLIYDDNQISIEDDTNIALVEDVAARYEAYGWHVQDVDWTNGGKEYKEDVHALYDAIKAAERVKDKPSFIRLKTIIAWPAPNKQGTGSAHGSALGADEVAATKEILGFDPEQTFEVPPAVIEHTRALRERGAENGAVWDEQYAAWAKKHPQEEKLLHRMKERQLPRGLGRQAAHLPRRREGHGDAQGLGRCDPGDREDGPRAVGRVGRPRRVQQHHHRGRSVVPARRPRHQDVEGRPAGRPGAPLRHPRARHGRDHERHRRPRRHPRLRRHLPHLLRLHARLGPAGGPDGPARSPTCGPTTRSGSVRTGRRTSRSSTWPPCARSPGSTSYALPTPTRPAPAGRPCSRTPTARPA